MYVVDLTLRGEPESYEKLHEVVRGLGPWSNRVGGGYLLECAWPAVQIRDLLKPHVQAGDRIFVAEFVRNWAATNMGADFPQWIGRRNFRELPGQTSTVKEG